MKLAKEAISLLSYDPNVRIPLWSSPSKALEAIFSIWDEADMIKVSDEEVSILIDAGNYQKDEVIGPYYTLDLSYYL